MEKAETKVLDKKFIILIILAFVLVTALVAFFEISLNKEALDPIDLPQTEDTSKYNSLVMVEVLTKNGGVYVSENGDLADFVELFNGTDKDINLYSYGLSDSKTEIKWSFPSVTIKAHSYLVVALTGKIEDGLSAPFKLKGSGKETLVLINKAGKVIDSVDTIPLNSNQVMVRDGESWSVTNYATPGYENSLKGLKSYTDSLLSNNETGLVINEFLPKNKGNFESAPGRFDGFIELKNVSGKAINLSDFYLSDDINVPFKKRLSDVVLAPNEVLLLYTGNNANYDNYLGFTLNNGSGNVILANNGKIVENIGYSNLAGGCAYIRDEKGNYYINSSISPGYENTTAGISAFQKEKMKCKEGLILSEVMSSNSSVLPQNGYKFYDYIELYNNSSESINLANYSLSTDNNNLSMWALPNIELKAHEYLVIICSGDTNLSNSTYIHSNFTISNDEGIYLSNNNKIVDSVFVYNIPHNYSYQRSLDYGWYYVNTPTPNKKNLEGDIAIASSPSITLKAGVYEGNDISTEIIGEGTIFYTTDGSTPSTSSKRYTGAIRLYKTTVIKAASYIDGQLISDPVTSSYIINDSHKLPVISVSLNPNEFVSLISNIYEDNTFQAYAEFFEEDGSFSESCGLKLQGETARRFAKKSYALVFESEYGAKDLNYQVFDEVDNSRFDKLVIRGGSNAASTLPWKDIFCTELASDYLEGRAYKTCIFYVNGQYQGIVNLREKINSETIATHYNVDKERVNLLKQESYGSTKRNAWVVENGENTYYELVEWAAHNDLTIQENYDYIASKINLENFCDFWIYQSYLGNFDIDNIRVFSHPDIDSGRYNYIFYDLDWSLVGLRGSAYSGNYLSNIVFNRGGWMYGLTYQGYDTRLHLALFSNSRFRELFLERVRYHLNNNLSTENVLKVFDSIKEIYADEIARDRECFWYSLDEYNNYVKATRELLSGKTRMYLNNVQYTFGLSNQEMKDFFGSLYE